MTAYAFSAAPGTPRLDPPEDAMKLVITEPEFGIYVGSALGLGFWSKVDSVGQDTAPVFDTKEQAQEQIDSWDCEEEGARRYDLAAVNVAAVAHYATFIQLLDPGDFI